MCNSNLGSFPELPEGSFPDGAPKKVTRQYHPPRPSICCGHTSHHHQWKKAPKEMRRNNKCSLSRLLCNRRSEAASVQDDRTISDDVDEIPLLDDFDVSEGDAWSTNSC